MDNIIYNTLILKKCIIIHVRRKTDFMMAFYTKYKNGTHIKVSALLRG